MPPLIALAISQLPSIVSAFRELFARNNPGLPPPTDEEVRAAFEAAFQSSLAKDQAWLDAHPEG